MIGHIYLFDQKIDQSICKSMVHVSVSDGFAAISRAEQPDTLFAAGPANDRMTVIRKRRSIEGAEDIRPMLSHLTLR